MVNRGVNLNLVYDMRTGDVIDPETGEVVDRIYDFRDWLLPRFEKYESKHSQTEPTLLLRNDTKREKRFLKIYYRVIDAASRLGIDGKRLRWTIKYVMMNTRSIYDEYKYWKKIRESYAAAVLYLASRMLKIGVSPRQIIDELQAEPSLTYQLYSVMKKRLGLGEDRKKMVLSLIDKIIATLGYPDMVYYYCLKILEHIDDYYLSGKNLSVVAAAIVDVARILAGRYDVMLKDIARITGVSDAAIRLHRRILEKKLNIEIRPKYWHASGIYEVIENEA